MVCWSMYSRSSRPSAKMTCIMPRASAASVPGWMAMCQSASFGGARLIGIDDDEPGAVAACLFDHGPEMNVVAVNVRAPGDDQARAMKLLGVGAELAAVDARGRRRRRRWSRWCDRAARRPAGGRSGGPWSRSRARRWCRRRCRAGWIRGRARSAIASRRAAMLSRASSQEMRSKLSASRPAGSGPLATPARRRMG